MNVFMTYKGENNATLALCSSSPLNLSSNNSSNMRGIGESSVIIVAMDAHQEIYKHCYQHMVLIHGQH